LSDKTIVFQEYQKTVNRLKERGVDISRVSFSYTEGIEEKDLIRWGDDRPFVKVFLDYMPQLALKLTGGALATALRLAEYINYDSGMLSKRGGNPLSNDDIQEIMGYSKKTTIRVLDELVCRKVLCRTRAGHSYRYFANPYLFTRGKAINKTLDAMFKNYPEEFKSLFIYIEGVEA
jgi:hypothetical protein